MQLATTRYVCFLPHNEVMTVSWHMKCVVHALTCVCCFIIQCHDLCLLCMWQERHVMR